MPIFIDLLVLVLWVVVLMAFVTQILIPAITGEPFFPLFRKSSVHKEISKAEDALGEVAEQRHLKAVTEEVNRQKAELEKKE